MIFNKKKVILLAICLLITNKQYIAAEPGNEVYKSLASSNEVKKQLDEEKAKADWIKHFKFLQDEEDKKAQDEEAKKAQDKAFDRLTELDKENIISCNDAIKYVVLFRKYCEYLRVKKFEVFRKGYEDFEPKFWNFSENTGKNYDRVNGNIIGCKPK